MSEPRASRTTAEWVTFGVASALLLAVAVSIGLLWLRPAGPPILTVGQVGEARTDAGHVYIEAEVRNGGGETAEAVQVLAELTVDGAVVEEGEQMVDFLPGGDSQRLVFIFDDRASDGEIGFRVGGYTVP